MTSGRNKDEVPMYAFPCFVLYMLYQISFPFSILYNFISGVLVVVNIMN